MKPIGILFSLLMAACSVAIAQSDRGSAAIHWQRVALGDGDARYDFAVYANQALGADTSRVREAVIVLHGLQRNGDEYYLAASKLLEASGASSDETLLMAPNFFAAPDAAKHDLEGIPLWSAQGWIAGEDSINARFALSSLQVLDDLIARVTDRKRFPSLNRIVVVGHSGGGQIVERYAVLNRLDEQIRAQGINLSYVVANPSSYLYFTNERPSGESFAPYNTVWCPNYNDYRYGFDNMIRYARNSSGLESFKRYAARNVTYLVGSNDIDPRHPVLDKTCGAEAEGPNRNERGRAYFRYERYLAGSAIKLDHRAFEVVDVGHDQAKMLGSRCATEAVFGVRRDDVTAAECRSIAFH